MKVGAYQFPMSGDIDQNLEHIKTGIDSAAKQGVRLLVFPECALTGYPPEDIKSVSDIDFTKVEDGISQLQTLAVENGMYIVVGTAERFEWKYYNSALIFSPNCEKIAPYRKRALWGWDLDNFEQGDNGSGVFTADGYRVGVRICYEVRFPEYFRELYKEKTDLDVVLFCDKSEKESPERYDLIKAHLRTRAVENVCSIVAVNNCAMWQTAPTIAMDDGLVVDELERDREGLLVYKLKDRLYGFGARGRKTESDRLTSM